MTALPLTESFATIPFRSLIQNPTNYIIFIISKVEELVSHRKTQMNTDIVRAGGSLIEDGAGNVVSQRFRRLQMNAT